MEAAIWMRGPGGPVLDTKGATAGADRNGRSEVWPVECNADISTMTASVKPSMADWVVHVAWPWLISANVLANVEDHTTNAERGIARLDPAWVVWTPRRFGVLWTKGSVSQVKVLEAVNDGTARIVNSTAAVVG